MGVNAAMLLTPEQATLLTAGIEPRHLEIPRQLSVGIYRWGRIGRKTTEFILEEALHHNSTVRKIRIITSDPDKKRIKFHEDYSLRYDSLNLRELVTFVDLQSTYSTLPELDVLIVCGQNVPKFAKAPS